MNRDRLHRRRDNWLEDEFRMWAFRTYYNGPFASVMDTTIRFIQAITHSARRPVDRAAERRWKAGYLRTALSLRRQGKRKCVVPAKVQ